MFFFFDNNLPPSLANAIKELCKGKKSVSVFHLREIFSEDTSDVKWINNVARRKGRGVIITSDRLKKGRAEKNLVRTSGLIWFFLAPGWNNLGFWVLSWKLIKSWPEIMEKAESAGSNSAFLIQASGKIKLL